MSSSVSGGGSSKGRERVRNQAMAQRLKREGRVRTSARCPICNQIVPLKRLYTHIVTHS